MNRRIPIRAVLFVLAAISVGWVIVRSGGLAYRDTRPVEDSPLRLDGCYHEVGDSSRIAQGTVIYPFLPWDDGTAAYFTRGYGKVLQDKGYGPLMFGSLAEARTVFENRMDSLLTGRKADAGQWDRFRVQGDSISLQIRVWDESSLQDIYRTTELSGKILHGTTFVLKKSVVFTGAYEGRHE